MSDEDPSRPGSASRYRGGVAGLRRPRACRVTGCPAPCAWLLSGFRPIPAGNCPASRRLLTKRSSLADLPPLVTAVAGRPTRLDVGGNEAQSAELVLESGDTRPIALLPARGRLRVPAIAEIGYHRLRVEDREIVLAVSPARCRSIEDVVPDARLWGLAAQLYGLNHPGDVGIGDLAGAADLARAAGAKGADAIALSPMHALYAADPARFGPYAPSSRLVPEPASRRAGAGLRTQHQGGTECRERPDRLAGGVGREICIVAQCV